MSHFSPSGPHEAQFAYSIVITDQFPPTPQNLRQPADDCEGEAANVPTKRAWNLLRADGR